MYESMLLNLLFFIYFTATLRYTVQVTVQIVKLKLPKLHVNNIFDT
jgi:hypothetical protein